MTPEEMVGAALEVARAGLAAGEQPIGAVVVLGDEVVAGAFTSEKTLGRRLVHAELLAMIEADAMLGWGRHSLRLAASLEPCLMCLGAAMALGVREVYFALESPQDGGAAVAAQRRGGPEPAWFATPAMTGGIRREESRDLFRRWCATAPDSTMRRWAETLLGPAGGYRAAIPDRRGSCAEPGSCGWRIRGGTRVRPPARSVRRR